MAFQPKHADPYGQAPQQQFQPSAVLETQYGQPQAMPQTVQPQHQQQQMPLPQQHQQPPPQQQQQAGLPQMIDTVKPTPGVRWTWSTFPDCNPLNAPKGQQPGAGCHMPEMVVPLAAMYTPLHQPRPDEQNPTSSSSSAAATTTPGETIPVIREANVPVCKACGTAWNMHSHVDANARFWACPSCYNRNPLPETFTPDHPALKHGVVEYALGKDPSATPIFIFVVDTCVPLEDLASLRSSLIRCLEWLPEDALVGFLSFGHSVTLWEIGYDVVNKCYALRGSRSYDKVELLKMISNPTRFDGMGAAPYSPSSSSAGTSGGGNSPMAGHSVPTPNKGSFANTPNKGSFTTTPNNSLIGLIDLPPAVEEHHPTNQIEGRFLCPLVECEFAVQSIIDDLTIDPFPVKTGERPLRATGAALELAVALMELIGGPRQGKILLFTGGPCTRGPGTVVSVDKAEVMRSHKDFADGNVPFYEDARKYYDALEGRLTAISGSIDAFVACLDQVGMTEMRHCINNTGGTMILTDTFDQVMFQESFRRFFARANFKGVDVTPSTPAQSGFGVEISVHTSNDTKVCGAVGLCRGKFAEAAASNNKDLQLRGISKHEVGIAKTTQWLISSADSNLTFTIVFDTETQPGTGTQQPGRRRFIQFIARFTTASGERRVRITSVSMPVAPSADPGIYIRSTAFDQGCAAAVASRIAIATMERTENSKFDSVRRWLDRLLVHFVKKFASYRPGEPESLRLDPSLSLFPSFVYNFRRSEYFSVINISPDETTHKRHFLMRETADNCLLMIQPTVVAYTIDNPTAHAVPLDSTSVKPDAILLMDAFFDVYVLKGAVVDQWEKAKYHEREDMAHFKTLLDQPIADCNEILAVRQPYPRHDVTDQYGSQARQVMARLNPAVTHTTSGVRDGRYNLNSAEAQQVIYTDESSIKRFMETLKAAAVSKD